MSTFLVGYDLNTYETAGEYQKLIKAIKELGTWAKPLESTFLVVSGLSASEIRDYLKNSTDSDDELLVMDVTDANWATWGIDKDVTSWMRNNI